MTKLLVKSVFLLILLVGVFAAGFWVGGAFATESIHQQQRDAYEQYYGDGGTE